MLSWTSFFVDLQAFAKSLGHEPYQFATATPNGGYAGAESTSTAAWPCLVLETAKPGRRSLWEARTGTCPATHQRRYSLFGLVLRYSSHSAARSCRVPHPHFALDASPVWRAAGDIELPADDERQRQMNRVAQHVQSNRLGRIQLRASGAR